MSVALVGYTNEHLPGIVRLCEEQGWPSLPADPQRAGRALSGPGVVTVVAVEDGEVVGFAQALTDGAIQAYLSLLLVGTATRGRGVGRELVRETLGRSGAERIDLFSEYESEGFYRAFRHRAFPGYRLYPDPAEE
jgi:ribosomal protein S18 acetylase RimI-like enzyme